MRLVAYATPVKLPGKGKRRTGGHDGRARYELAMAQGGPPERELTGHEREKMGRTTHGVRRNTLRGCGG